MFPHQNPAYESPLPHTRYMLHPSYFGDKYLLLNYKFRKYIKTLILTTRPPRCSKNSKAVHSVDGGELSVSRSGHLILDKASNTYWMNGWLFSRASIFLLWPQNHYRIRNKSRSSIHTHWVTKLHFMCHIMGFQSASCGQILNCIYTLQKSHYNLIP